MKITRDRALNSNPSESQRIGVAHNFFRAGGRLLVLAFGSFISICHNAQAQTQTDFDGDDISDVAYTEASGTSLVWKSVPSTLGGDALDESFGLTTDSIALAHWLDDSSPTLGIIRLRPRDNKLAWKIFLPGGTLKEEIFGQGNDLTLSGADFNGNSVADAAVVRIIKGVLQWEIKRDLFSDPSKTIKRNFGKNGDRAFYASPDGERDWLGTFGRTGTKQTVLRLFDLKSKKVRTTKKIPLRFAQDPRPRPLPLKQSDGTDCVVFVETDESDTSLTTYSLKGKRISKQTIIGLGNVTIGDYLPEEEGEEIALSTSSKTRIFNPVTEALVESAGIPGTPLDENNVTLIAGVATATPTPTPVGE